MHYVKLQVNRLKTFRDIINLNDGLFIDFSLLEPESKARNRVMFVTIEGHDWTLSDMHRTCIGQISEVPGLVPWPFTFNSIFQREKIVGNSEQKNVFSC